MLTIAGVVGKLHVTDTVESALIQVYQGLDIVTNKVTVSERSACPHHMMDFVSPLKLNYTVTDFKNTSLKIVSFLSVQDEYCRELLC